MPKLATLFVVNWAAVIQDEHGALHENQRGEPGDHPKPSAQSGDWDQQDCRGHHGQMAAGEPPARVLRLLKAEVVGSGRLGRLEWLAWRPHPVARRGDSGLEQGGEPRPNHLRRLR